jgi:hypothetical protein
MKTVATFSKPYEAHLLISRLEGSGVAAFTRDENMITLDWLASNAIGGVKVDVADEDYERALAVIAATATTEEKAAAASAHARVSELDRGFRRAVLKFVVGAIPLGLVGYFVAPAPAFKAGFPIYAAPPADLRPLVAAVAAITGGLAASALLNRKKENPPSGPRPSAPE